MQIYNKTVVIVLIDLLGVKDIDGTQYSTYYKLQSKTATYGKTGIIIHSVIF